MSASNQSAAERAMSATAPIRKVFGQMIHVECVDVGWDDGERRYTPFNPSVHGSQQPRTDIRMEAEVYKRVGMYVAKKNMIDSSKVWQDITRASMIKLGLTLSNLEKRWVEIELRRTGRTWDDKTTGETKYEEAFYFTRVFKDRDECDTAYAEHTGAYSNNRSSTSSTDYSNNAAAANGGKTDEDEDDGNNDTMNNAANTIWTITQKDPEQFKVTVSANPMLMKHFGSVDAALAFVQGGAPVAPVQPTPTAPAPAAKQPKNKPQPVATTADDDDDLPF